MHIESGTGILLSVTPEAPDELEPGEGVEAVGIVLRRHPSHDDGLAGATVTLHWWCGPERAEAWLSLRPSDASYHCYYSGQGEYVTTAAFPLSVESELVAHWVALDATALLQDGSYRITDDQGKVEAT